MAASPGCTSKTVSEGCVGGPEVDLAMLTIPDAFLGKLLPEQTQLLCYALNSSLRVHMLDYNGRGLSEVTKPCEPCLLRHRSGLLKKEWA